jgi:hypothetical protein
MLEALEIYNFQSHESSKLEFHPGLNVIVGPSDNGKSAVIRDLIWIIRNKPDGFGFVSHWNLTEKGALRSATYSVLTYDEGKKLIRRRTKDLNQYEVKGRILDAIGRDVPSDVEKALDITEINIQEQLDPHFLLSDSAGEVARILNRTIRLDDIDKLLALVEQKKRATKNSSEQASLQLNQINDELLALSWIDDIDMLIQKGQTLAESVTLMKKIKDALSVLVTQYKSAELEVVLCDVGSAEYDVEEVQKLNRLQINSRLSLNDLGVSLGRYQEASADIKNLPDIYMIDEVIVTIDIHQKKLISIKNTRIKLKESLGVYQSAQSLLDEVNAIPAIDEQIILVQSIKKEIDTNVLKAKSLKELLEAYSQFESDIMNLNKTIHDLVDKLPDVCPLCNGTGKIKEGV